MNNEIKSSARRTNALSRERIVAEAIAILDADGEDALTFRALAERLSTGSGAIYYHIASKDELLAAAANTIITELRKNVKRCDDPSEEIRSLALDLFDAFEAHPWVGSQLSNEPSQLGNAQIFEAIGSKLAALGVPLEAQFNVSSALGSYIMGVAKQEAVNARLSKHIALQGMDRAAFLTQLANKWKELDPAEYPFVHHIAGLLPEHDDREQFIAGVDLLLRGIKKSKDI